MRQRVQSERGLRPARPAGRGKVAGASKVRLARRIGGRIEAVASSEVKQYARDFKRTKASIPDVAGAAQLPDDRELVMRVMPMPADANANGDIFGGWIMAQVDLAGAVLPARIAKGRIATVAVNQFVFKQPVSIGDLLSFYAKVERIGRTSVTVHVEVYAERNPADLHVVKVTEANLTYVAIDTATGSRGRSRRPDARGTAIARANRGRRAQLAGHAPAAERSRGRSRASRTPARLD